MSKHDDCWSTNDTCIYKQTIAVNPMVGGFSPYEELLADSSFKSYEFFGTYKVSANNNQVNIYTTDECSQMSVTFDFACVIFQARVIPQKRKTNCKQVIEFNEQQYSLQISPFVKQDIDIGLVIFASGNSLVFYHIDLKSLTNQDIIAAQLHQFIEDHLPIHVDDSPVTEPVATRAAEPIKSAIPVTSYSYKLTPSQPTTTNQTITLSNPTMAQGNVFSKWQVRDYTGKNVKFASDPAMKSASWSVNLPINTRYSIGFVYTTFNPLGVINTFYGTIVNIPVNASNATIVPKL